MKKIGIIGCGNMGGAIATALSTNKDWSITLYDSNDDLATGLAIELGCIASPSITEMIRNCQYIILAVKPQILPSLYQIFSENNAPSKYWISIAAGVPLSVLCEKLGTGNVVRFMPNIAAKAKKAVTAVASCENADKELTDTAMEIATSFGSAFALPESQFAAFIGISGSAIAYVFEFFHALAMGGVEEGIPYPTALAIARDTCISAATLQKETGKGAVELATMVCSAGGTTIKGMKALAQGNFDATVMSAVSASAEKSRQLEELAKQK
ncbi:pyrroline-5-carboxylate reductase [Sphaerochaeta pleomorpha str. Grapes]|uniref:Pyrroline-5-carboxylate reductase n=1 Tax=Sphaerochaeta pleomorpha (strain ATCC BAA-1885 / DSM 22778 / Grapes) TaxID=158190 RepID=G8QQL3_SPHPG|nr:pyrroline-5-carboxylate reductase [Sphaerochaeta pleomorpha]AEV30943.1 pyrroline-5-carboxylate reductase [Sphaerochaeta pleomorpha str. Grapes]